MIWLSCRDCLFPVMNSDCWHTRSKHSKTDACVSRTKGKRSISCPSFSRSWHSALCLSLSGSSVGMHCRAAYNVRNLSIISHATGEINRLPRHCAGLILLCARVSTGIRSSWEVVCFWLGSIAPQTRYHLYCLLDNLGRQLSWGTTNTGVLWENKAFLMTMYSPRAEVKSLGNHLSARM